MTDRHPSSNLRLLPPWEHVGETNGVADWKCRECGHCVSRGIYPTHLSHEKDCSYSAWPIIDRAEQAEAKVARLERELADYKRLGTDHEAAHIACLRGVVALRADDALHVAGISRNELDSLRERIRALEQRINEALFYISRNDVDHELAHIDNVLRGANEPSVTPSEG